MDLSIKVRLEDEEKGYVEEEIRISMRNLSSMKSMAARTLLVEVPSVIEELFDEEREWVKPKPVAKKPVAKKPVAKKPVAKKPAPKKDVAKK